MKIVHSSGEELELNPGTVLDISRTNPFFNNYGEQSLPVKLPSGQRNRRILGYPEDLSGIRKMSQRADASIQEGVFFIQCRQAVLSADDKEIDTSYYLNVGSFYEKMKNLKLTTIFKDKVIRFNSVESAISYVRGTMINQDPKFTCFPILIEHQDTGNITALNRFGAPIKSDGYFSLINEVTRTETVDDNIISVPPGFYITPLVRVMHVLEETFKFLGYSMDDNFFTRTEPFASMVFLNNNIDTIVNEEIRYEQIVPDITVSALLDIFRYRFCCEFIPDEVRKKIKIVLFNEVVEGKPVRDLSAFLTNIPKINHGAKYKQIKLSAEKGPIISWSTDGTEDGKWISSTPDYLNKTLPDIASMYPEAMIDKSRGIIYREGFSADRTIREIVGCVNCDYFAGESDDFDTEKKESPDVMVNIDSLPLSGGDAPFVGVSRSLNSNIVLDDVPRQSSTSADTTQNKSELKAMMCFVVHTPERRYDYGTIYAHDPGNTRLWPYALCYNGPDGLYEKFWRKYDDMLRNSMRPVTAKLLLNEIDKLNLTCYEKVSIHNQELLPNVIKYPVGKTADAECTFLTTKLYEPLVSAKSESDHFPDSKYRWNVRWKRSDNDTYTYFKLKETPVTFFPPPPTEEQYRRGGKYYEKSFAVELGMEIELPWGKPIIVGKVDGTFTVWLEPVVREY